MVFETILNFSILWPFFVLGLCIAIALAVDFQWNVSTFMRRGCYYLLILFDPSDWTNRKWFLFIARLFFVILFGIIIPYFIRDAAPEHAHNCRYLGLLFNVLTYIVEYGIVLYSYAATTFPSVQWKIFPVMRRLYHLLDFFVPTQLTYEFAASALEQLNMTLPNSNDAESNCCVACQERPKSIVLLPCRHLCLCRNCSLEFQSKQSSCPLCREEIIDVMQVYV